MGRCNDGGKNEERKNAAAENAVVITAVVITARSERRYLDGSARAPPTAFQWTTALELGRVSNPT